VRRPMSKNELLTMLYGDASAKPDNCERLNPGTGSHALPGEMIVVKEHCAWVEGLWGTSNDFRVENGF
jgi:hypothetical protein